MKSYNFEYQNAAQFYDCVINSGIKRDSKNILVQVFTSLTQPPEILTICGQIKQLLPGAQIIGTTSYGEIAEQALKENATVLSISVFDTTTVQTALVKCQSDLSDEYQTGVTLAKRLNSPHAKVIIMFSDGIYTNSDELLRGIESINNRIVVAGGRASDNGSLQETLIFNDCEITNRGAVGAVLANPQLQVYNFYSLCWNPIGKKMTITKAQEDTIYEIDNIKIREVYRKYLGEEVANNLPKSATEFALLTKRNSLEIARVAFGENAEGIRYIGGVFQGEKVVFCHGNYYELLKKSQETITAILKNPVESIFIYSCVTKKIFFQEKILDEIVPLAQITNCAGTFCYGEFFHHHKKNITLNLTTTYLALAEHNTYQQVIMAEKKQRKIANIIDNKQNIIIDALAHLANKVTQELDEINQNLTRKNHDYKQLLKEYNKQNIELASSNKKLREHQNNLIQMEKFLSLGQFASGIAHNLQTPLMTSSGGILKLQQDCQQLRALLENSSFDQKAAELLLDDMSKWQNRIKNYLLYMSDCIRTVKDQVQNNKDIGFFTIGELIAKVQFLLDLEITRRNSSLQINVDPIKDFCCRGDINYLVQVFSNVIINAVESYDGKRGEVKLTGKIQGQNVEFHIKDHGKGIPKKIARKIFTEMITTKGKNGTGLGLYIAYLIIKTHFSGDIYFHDNTNHGTVFVILLPYYSPEKSRTVGNEEKLS